MYQPLCALLLALTLLAGAPHPAAAAHAPARHAAPAAQAEQGDRGDGLALTGEMLFGGILLMTCSAYALRRSRR